MSRKNDTINYKGDEGETDNFKIYFVLIIFFFCRFDRIKCEMGVDPIHFHIMTCDCVTHLFYTKNPSYRYCITYHDPELNSNFLRLNHV